MKRIIKSLMCAVVAMTALVSCQKEKFSEITSVSGEKIEVSIAGSIGDFVQVDDTKATAQSVVRVTWAQDDKVYVYDGSECLGTLTVTPDAKNASYALLSGTITASSLATAPEKLTLVYNNTATEAPAISEGKVSIDLSNQSETDVPFVLYATIDYDTAKLEKTDEYVPFSFATSVMTVNVTDLPTGAENAKIDITKAEIDAVSTVCELTISSDAEPTVAGASKGVITRSAGFAQSDSRGTFTIAVAAETAAQSARRILVYQEAKVSGAPFATTTTFAENKSYNTVCQLSEYVQSVPDGMLSGEFTVSADGKKVHFSQGNLWYGKVGDAQTATFNFETNQYESQPTANGDWNSDHISHFFWSRNKDVACASSYSESGTSGSDVFFTNADAETAKSDFTVNGVTGKYRTLSADEWKYLFSTRTVNGGTGSQKSYSLNITYNGKMGLVLYPDNYDKDPISGTVESLPEGVVFLPVVGYRSKSNINNISNMGNYWSSVADGSKALSVQFGSGNLFTAESSNRSYGYSVRLVTESAGSYAPAVKVTGISLASSKDTVEVGASKALVATVTPSNAAHQEINWSSSDETVATVDENGEVTGVAEGQAIITATTVDGNFTASAIVTVEAGVELEYVEIGGLKWATMNLGATTVAGSYTTCYGDLYQWGSVNTLYDGFPWTSATAGSFTWKTGKDNGFNDSNREYTGNDATLPDANDVVKQTIGGGWRMPTSQEFKDLYDACLNGSYDTTTNPSGASASVGKGVYWCTSYDGVAGCLFCDGTNKLFFPAAGNGNGTLLNVAGIYGYYWSSSLNKDNTGFAESLLFFSSSVLPQNPVFRYAGFSVRPVSDK